MAHPRVSIVLPTYQRAHQIGASLQSLLMQTFPDFEVLVRDDGDGSDGTPEVVGAIAGRDPRVIYSRNEHTLRMPKSLNAGITQARGEFVVVCHDHDLYQRDYLERLVAAADRHPSALFVHCGITVMSQDGHAIADHLGPWPELMPGAEWLKIMLRKLSCPVCALTLVRRSAYERYGVYDQQYGFVADAEMWMRLALLGDVSYVKEPLIQVREREPDHFAHKAGRTHMHAIARIHRKYLPLAYQAGTLHLYRAALEARVLKAEVMYAVARARSTVKRAGS